MLENYIQELHANIENKENNEMSKSKSGMIKWSENRVLNLNVKNNKVLIRRPFVAQFEKESMSTSKPIKALNKISSEKQFWINEQDNFNNY